MIAANELRMGNWVKSNNPHDGRFVKFKYFHEDLHVAFFYKEAIGAFTKDIVGIPLTPEILEKCGFVKPTKNDNHGGLLVSIGNDVSIRLKPLISGDGYYWDNFNGAYKVIIKHLHQLQNIYFALTNEELNYTP